MRKDDRVSRPPRLCCGVAACFRVAAGGEVAGEMAKDANNPRLLEGNPFFDPIAKAGETQTCKVFKVGDKLGRAEKAFVPIIELGRKVLMIERDDRLHAAG